MTGNLKMRLGLMTDAAGDSSKPDPGTPLIWKYTVPNFEVYEDQLDYLIEMETYVSYPAGDTVAWTVTGDATIDPVTGRLLVNVRPPGDTLLTVTADNGFGPQPSNQFTVTVLEGYAPVLPIWDLVPNFYSVEGIEGGNEVPPQDPSQRDAGTMAEESGVEMLPYILNQDTHPILPGTWVLQQGGQQINIADQNTGRLVGNPNTPDGIYPIQVSVRNSAGGAASAVFSWQVIDNLGFIVDFSEAAHGDWQGLVHTRGGDQAFINYITESSTVSGDTAALVGREFTDNAYTDRQVSYGVDMRYEAPITQLGGLLAGLEDLPYGGMELEVCFQIVVRLNELPTGGQYKRLFALRSGRSQVPGQPDGNDAIAELVLFTGSAANTFSVSVRTTDYQVGAAEDINGYIHAQCAPISGLAIGDVLEFRGRVQKPAEGGGNNTIDWKVYRNTYPTQTPLAEASDSDWPETIQVEGMSTLALANNTLTADTTYANNVNIIYVRLVPTGYLDEAIIYPPTLGTLPEFVFWQQPIPVAVQQPNSIHFGATEQPDPLVLEPLTPISAVGGTPVTLSAVVAGDGPLTVVWEFDPKDGQGLRPITEQPALNAQNADTTNATITLPIDANTYTYKVTVDNAAMLPQASTSTATTTAITPVVSGELALLFIDILDGVNNGWHESSTEKGAVVTLYGAGFGTKNADSQVLFGGTPVPDGHIIEWNEPQYPASFPGLYMITVNVGSNVGLGQQPISVKTGNGSGGNIKESSSHPFFVRSEGTIKYFDATAPDGNGDGSFDNPYRYPGDVFRGSSSYADAGEHYYFKDGTYIPQGNNKRSVVFLFGGRAKTGFVNNGVQLSAYPGAKNVVFSTLGIAANTDSKGIRGLEDRDCYVFSKFDIYAWHGSILMPGANYTAAIGNRCNGMSVHGSGSGDIAYGGKHKNNSRRVLGNELRGGDTLNKYDHAIYPGGGGTDWGGNEVAYNYVHSNDYRQGGLVSYNYSENDDNSPDDEVDRIERYAYVKSMSFHHNLIDCRILDPAGGSGLYTAVGLGLNGTGDNRPIYNMPTEGQVFSDPFYIYNNIFISDHRIGTPTDGDKYPSICPMFLAGGSANLVITGNLFLGFHEKGAIAYALGKNDPEKNHPDWVPRAQIMGNMMIGLQAEPTDKYWGDAFSTAKIVEASNNIYWNGQDGTFILNDINPLVADPLLSYDIDAVPLVLSLPANSPAANMAANYGLATHDYNHKPYTPDGKFPAGAVLPEESAEDD